MIGADLMRDAALLGAECQLAIPRDEVPSADDGWTARAPERAALKARLDAHERSADPTRKRLCDGLGLDAPAYWLVMLCAAVEVHPEAAAAVSLLAEDPRAQLPTPTVVARLLRGLTDRPYAPALAAAIDGGPAGRMGLVEALEPVPGLPHTQQALRIVKSELAAALEAPELLGVDRALELTAVAPAALMAFSKERVEHAARLLEHRRVLVLRGPARRGARQLACDIASLQEQPANLITVTGEIPPLPELARMRDGLLVLDLHALTAVPHGRLAAISSALGPVVALVDGATDTGDHPSVEVAPVGYPEAVRVWTPLVGEAGAHSMAARFRVGAEEAQSALREAAELHEAAASADDAAHLDAVASRIRAQGARRMGRHVTVIETGTKLDDLVVSSELRRQLGEIVDWQRSSHRVRWDMGLGEVDRAGMGLTCLFAGKSGTGKTFATRCLAGELGLNLYRIDLSQVVSKYIGETEKALAQVFDEVEAGHGVLLFDEADALFGRRSEVKDAHDRYANIEVGYLLQRLESYEGIAVLTTNLQGNMDAAFVRRLRFILQFPAPDRELRRRLWERSLPGDPWRADDLELGTLAERFQLTGGAIHNVGLAAAHLAAATESGKITFEHVLRATQRELQKTGRPSDAAAFAGKPAGRRNGANGARA